MAVNIDQSYYRSGTATVDAAGTVVTGQDTQWVSATRANDLFGTHTGDGVRILSVDSDTQLTLAYPWSGPAQVASDYEIQFTPYDTGYYPTVRNLLQTMTSGNVEALAGLAGVPDGVPVFTGSGTMELGDYVADSNGSLLALAGLTGAADTMPYFTGAGTMGRTGLTAFARTLLDDANAASAMNTLGATAFGRSLLGVTGVAGHALVATGADTVRQQQLAVYGGVRQVENLPIINSNTTANGTWVRFLDGTMICFNSVSLGNRATATVANNLYRTADITLNFPSSFISTPTVATSIGSGNGWMISAAGATATTITIQLLNLNNITTAIATSVAFYIAIGRWK